ncbi:MAG: BON domain-containing protein [Pyrinomonadaceae bacterium]
MQKLLKMSLLITAIGLVSTACTTTDTRESTTSPTPAGAVANMSDSELEGKIKAQFNTDAELKSADLDVDADVDQNKVTLSGTVESEVLRTKAAELARGTHAGLVVTDKIDVKPREVSRVDYTQEMARGERERAKTYSESIGDSLDDAWIHAKIVAKLIDNFSTPERKINVDVENNVVTLHGTIDNKDQKMEAERIAKNTDGVKRVNNQLKVN